MTIDGITRPLRVSPDGRFLTRSDGSPFFWLADTAWCLFGRSTREEADEYLVRRAKQRFTVVQAVATVFPGGRVDTLNRYGEIPFLDGDPFRPNPRHFEHVEWVVDRARELGLRMAVLPIFEGGMVLGATGPHGNLFTPESARWFGSWLAERLGGRGIVWVLGGDITPVAPGPDGVLVDMRPIFDALADGIRAVEGDDAFLTYHPSVWGYPGLPEPRTSLYLHDREWLTMNMIQSSHFGDDVIGLATSMPGADFHYFGACNYQPIAAEYASIPVRPIIDGEPRYEDLAINVEMDPALIRGYWDAFDVRNAAYHSVFAGAAGHSYGHHSVWQMYDPDLDNGVQGPREGLSWRIALDAVGANQMCHLRALVESRPAFSAIPDQGLVLGEPGVGEAHIGALRDRAGRYLMLYLGRPRPISVDLTRIAGSRATAWWFDPRTGDAEVIAEGLATDRVRTFVPPSLGERDDRVLVIDDAAAGLGVPGVVP